MGGVNGTGGIRPIFDAGHLAVVHAVNAPGASHSHFTAQDGVERTSPRDMEAAACAPRAIRWPRSGVGLSAALPLSLAGPLNPRTSNFRSVARHVLSSTSGATVTERRSALEAIYAGAPRTTAVGAAGISTFGALEELSAYREGDLIGDRVADGAGWARIYGREPAPKRSGPPRGRRVSILLRHERSTPAHTDARGSDVYNLSLSERRAESVRRYLIELSGSAAWPTQLADDTARSGAWLQGSARRVVSGTPLP